MRVHNTGIRNPKVSEARLLVFQSSARPRLIQPHDVVEHPDEPQKNYEEDEDGKIVPHRQVQLFVIHRRGGGRDPIDYPHLIMKLLGGRRASSM